MPSDLEQLFRKDVIERKSHRIIGDVVIRRSRYLNILTILIMLCSTSAITWAAISRFARTESAQGILMPSADSAKIYASHSGVIEKLLVHDGDVVHAGQTLAIIKIESPTPGGTLESDEVLYSNYIQTQLAAKQIGLSQQRSGSELKKIDETIKDLQKQALEITNQIELQSNIVKSVTQSYNQIQPIVNKGFVSKLEFEHRHQIVLSEQENLSRLRQQLGATRAETAKAEDERHRVFAEGQADRATARSALEALRQQRMHLKGEVRYGVVSPISGRITAMQANPGNPASPSVPLMIIVPDNVRLRADLFVPSRSVGFLKEGQEVRLLYDAFPYQKFGSASGRIENISHFAVSGLEANSPFKIDEPVYRIAVNPSSQNITAYGEKHALHPGMTLKAVIIIERESFFDWLLEPIRAVSNRNQ